MLEEVAPAKINLTLCVHGKRPDGYHELDSLVVFATCGDRVRLVPGPDLAVEADGEFAAAILDENLIRKAAAMARASEHRLTLGTFVLDKQLPVAAGLGGGSSDAAAALRLIRRANPSLSVHVDWHTIAAACGADVPVCLMARAAHMQGLGDKVTPIRKVPHLGCLLANPRQPLSTADVFRALQAPALSQPVTAARPLEFASADALIAFVRNGRNDLEPPAIRLCPVIGEVRSALAALPGAIIARMSGSGPTCFALFDCSGAAEAAEQVLRAQRPGWWVASGALV